MSEQNQMSWDEIEIDFNFRLGLVQEKRERTEKLKENQQIFSFHFAHDSVRLDTIRRFSDN